MARLVFNLLIVPAAALLRLLGVDPMGLRRDPRAATYWKRRRKGVRMTSQF
jgi:hypothetical protein